MGRSSLDPKPETCPKREEEEIKRSKDNSHVERGNVYRLKKKKHSLYPCSLTYLKGTLLEKSTEVQKDVKVLPEPLIPRLIFFQEVWYSDMSHRKCTWLKEHGQ